MAECKSCGGFVTDNYARVFGDNENEVYDCRNCPAPTREDTPADEGDRVLLRDVRENASGDGDDDVPSGDDLARRDTEELPEKSGFGMSSVLDALRANVR